jgi:hypothetical protein
MFAHLKLLPASENEDECLSLRTPLTSVLQIYLQKRLRTEMFLEHFLYENNQIKKLMLTRNTLNFFFYPSTTYCIDLKNFGTC